MFLIYQKYKKKQSKPQKVIAEIRFKSVLLQKSFGELLLI